MGWLENVTLRNKALQNERLELTDKDSLYFLGPELTLTACTVVLKVSARRLHLLGVRFIDCEIEVKQELKNHQEWIGAELKGCRFKGRLSGCDFGHWPEYGRGLDPGYQLGSIEDCDFTEARLDGCRFMGCDPATLRLPRWPCFTLLDPIGRAAEYRGATWPGRIGPVVIDDLHTEPSATRAVTYHAPTLAKQLGATESQLRAVIERFDGIVY